MRTKQEQIALRHHAFGRVEDVLRTETAPLPRPNAREVLVRVECAAVHPSDFGRVNGSYGALPKLPATGGREAVGTVVECTGKAEEAWLGKRVHFTRSSGAWAQYAAVPEAALHPVPPKLALEDAARAGINPPTAWCLLRDCRQMKRGAWILQNAANSSVGTCVIQLAREFGLHTLNTVRRREVIEPLRALGADAVFMDGDEQTEIEAYVRKLAVSPLLALNSIGGQSARNQLRLLGDHGTQITFGGMVGEPIRHPTRQLIFNDHRQSGFWLDAWKQMHHPIAFRRILSAIFVRLADHTLQLPPAEGRSLHQMPKPQTVIFPHRP